MSPWRSKDFWAGLKFIVFGLAFVIIARDYSMGSAARMGPSYFPTALGGVLVLFGVVISGRAFFAARHALGHFGLRPVFMVMLAVVLFAMILEYLGLIGASVALVFVGAAAGPEFKFKGTVLLWLVLIIFSIVVFHYGLGLPIPLAPSIGIEFW